MKNADMPASRRLEAQNYVVDSHGHPCASTDQGPVFIRWRVVESGSLKTVCDGLKSSADARLFSASPGLVAVLKDILRIAKAASIGVSGNDKRIAKADALLAALEQPETKA